MPRSSHLVELGQPFAHRGLLHHHALHKAGTSGGGRLLAQQLLEALKALALSLRDDLDATVGQVADVPDESQFARLRRCPPAKADALDLAVDNDRHALHAAIVGGMECAFPARRDALPTLGATLPAVSRGAQVTAGTQTCGQPRMQGAERPAQRVPGLDGLRALAILAVLLFHLNPSWLPGGFLGVDAFFVVSGFLITTLLVRELSSRGLLDLGGFWTRRARRLLPALLVCVPVSILAARLVQGDLLVHVARQALGALTFSTNWVEIAGSSTSTRPPPSCS